MQQETEAREIEVEEEERSRLVWRTVTLRPPWQPLSTSSRPRPRIQPRGARSVLIPGLLDVGLHLDTARPPQEPIAVVDRVLVIRDAFTIKTHLWWVKSLNSFQLIQHI